MKKEIESVPKVCTLGATSLVARFTAYTLVILVIFASLVPMVYDGDTATFRENGPIEWTQFGLIVVTSAVFLSGACFVTRFRQVFFLLASICATAAFRELDSIMDRAIPLLGWKIGLFIPVLALCALYAGRNILGAQVRAFVTVQGFAILWTGFIVIVAVAQVVGHGDLLKQLLGDGYTRHYKRFIEETLELIGYWLLLVGGFESLLQLRGSQREVHGASRKRKEPSNKWMRLALYDESYGRCGVPIEQCLDGAIVLNEHDVACVERERHARSPETQA